MITLPGWIEIEASPIAGTTFNRLCHNLFMSRNDQLLQVFYEAYRLGDDPLGMALAQYRTELNPELAKQASDGYIPAMQHQDLNTAMAAATIGSRIYNFIGLREEAFNAMIDSFSVLYMRAETVDAYADIYTAIRDVMAGNPYGEGSPLTGLRALNLAADCGFFASEATADPKVKKFWLQAALAALVDGTKYLGASTADLIPGYTSTAVAVYRRCVGNGWVGEPWAAAPLTAVTAKLDSAVPSKVNYSGDDAKTSNIDAARTEMSGVFNHSAYVGGETPAVSPLSGLFGHKTGG